jgi:hypothetical protein
LTQSNDEKTPSEEADEALALVRDCAALFAGKSAGVQGAALADLLALYLAGHVVRDDPSATRMVREALLEQHLKIMWKLVPINFKGRIEPRMRKGRGNG